jgi:hypothetical protein
MVYRTTYWFSQHFPLNYQPPSREVNYYGPLVLVPPIPPIPGGGGGGSNPRAKPSKRIVKLEGRCVLRCDGTGALRLLSDSRVVEIEATGTLDSYAYGELTVIRDPKKARRIAIEDEEVVALVEAYLNKTANKPKSFTITFRN